MYDFILNAKRTFPPPSFIARFRSAIFFRLQPYRGLLLRLAVVSGVLVTAPVAGILIGRGSRFALIVPVAPLLLFGLQFILQRPNLAPLIVLIAAAFVPVSLSTGTESRLVDSLLLTLLFTGIWVVKMLTVEKRLYLKPSPVNKPLLGFMLVTLFSLVWSIGFRDPLVVIWQSFPVVQIASAVVMIMLPGAFLLVANQIDDLKLLKAMVAIMLFAGIPGLIRQYGLAPIPVNTGGLFAMWIITLSTGLALFNRRMPLLRRGLLLALAGGWVYWGFGLHISWLAGWLPGFVALSVLGIMRSRKLFLILLILVVALIAGNADYYLGSVIEAESESSGNTRLAAWEVNWRVTSQHWLLGTGPAGYAAYYMSYFPKEGMATHNNYLDVLAQTGVIGLVFCVWFFIVLVWRGYKLSLRLKGRGDFLEALANAALAGTVSCIVSMAFGDWLFPFAYTQTIAGFDHAVYSWLFMGTILVLDRLTLTEAGAASDA